MFRSHAHTVCIHSSTDCQPMTGWWQLLVRTLLLVRLVFPSRDIKSSLPVAGTNNVATCASVPQVQLHTASNNGFSAASSRDQNGLTLSGTLMRRLNLQPSNMSILNSSFPHPLAPSHEGVGGSEPGTPGFAAYVPQVLHDSPQGQPPVRRAATRRSAFSTRLAGCV